MADPENSKKVDGEEKVELSAVKNEPLPSMPERKPSDHGIEASPLRGNQDQVEYGFGELDDALRKGDSDAIRRTVSPKTLARCKSNALLTAFQVNKQLRYLADSANPEKGDIEMLEKSIDAFTSALIDPLKADAEADTRSTFQSCFDDVVDNAIDTKQKKFISHPVVFDLLKSRWYRSFSEIRKNSWWTPKRWGYFFLNLWTVFDIVFFPFLFAIFFVAHLMTQAFRRKRETKMSFVLTLGEDTSEKEFDLIKKTIKYIIHEYGCHSAKYFVVLHENHEMIGNINFEESSTEAILQEKIDLLRKPRFTSSLCEDLATTRTRFAVVDQEKAKKVVVLFLNDSLQIEGACTKIVEEIQEEMHINIVAIGIGEYAKLSELNLKVTKDDTALHLGEYESPETLGTAVIQGIEGKTMYEKYKDYFTTPYFVFFRDTLSYLTLLGLHFAICLSPSTVAFSQIEWVILVFYLGRVLMEVDQVFSDKKAGEKVRKLSKRNRDGYQQVPVDQQETNEEAGEDNILLTKRTHYFSDYWNVLDITILVFYLITFILRVITWKNSTEVSDNRLLAVSGYLYGFITMFLTLRAFGQVSERVRGMGAIQIALFFVMWDVMTILWQFLATILAFSMAMTKVYVAEKAYTSGKDSAKDLACSESGIICWWTMATHLGWSLLNLANLDAFNSVDNPSVSLIHVLYSFFLIMAVILLANMMIALLSSSYQRVQDNALQEWSFKRAITVRTYSIYHPIPVPFNLLSTPLIALWNLCWLCLCGTCFDNSASCEGERIRQREALNKVVKKLQTMYFEKYGYEFPLTEGKKIDHLVQENEGSRKLTNQIVRQVFRPRGNKEEKIASGQSAWYYSPGISVDGCLLTYSGSKEIHSAKFKSPFTPETPRFEVLIQETGESRIVALGAVYESYECHRMPGWGEGTVGYHADDGKIFDGFHGQGIEVEGAMAYRGDLMACEVDFSEVSKDEIPVLFFLNGKEVARSLMKYTSGQELFPFVSLGFKGITVLTKMCHRDRGCLSPVTNADIQKEIGTLRGDVQHLLAEQARMFSEMRILIQLSKEVKAKEEQEEAT